MTKSKKRAKKATVAPAIAPRPPATLLFSAFSNNKPTTTSLSAEVVERPASSDSFYPNYPLYASSQYASSADAPFLSVEDPRRFASNTSSQAIYPPPPQSHVQYDYQASDYQVDGYARAPYTIVPPVVPDNSLRPHAPYSYAPSVYYPVSDTAARYSRRQDYDVTPQNDPVVRHAPQSYVSQMSQMSQWYAPQDLAPQPYPAQNYPPSAYVSHNYSSRTQSQLQPQPLSRTLHIHAPQTNTSYNAAQQASTQAGRPDTQTPQQLQQSRYNLRSRTSPPAPRSQQQGHSASPTRAKSQTPSTIPMPSMTPEYLQLASKACSRLKEPQPLLVISDLNGTLLHRKRAGTTTYKERPGLDEFLRYVFMTRSPKSTHPSRDAGTIHPMIWTSAQPETCQAILKSLLSPKHKKDCVAIWARDTLRLTPSQYRNKTQVYKRLEWIWSDESIQKTHPHRHKGARWDQTNTLLIDDSIIKALAQPYNLINLPEFDEAAVIAEARLTDEEAVLAQVVAYIDEARWWSNVSTYVKRRSFKIGQWIVDRPGNKPQEGVRLNFVDLTLED